MLLISLIETADSSLILTASVHDASLEAEGYIKLPLPTANPARTLVLRGSIITHLQASSSLISNTGLAFYISSPTTQ